MSNKWHDPTIPSNWKRFSLHVHINKFYNDFQPNKLFRLTCANPVRDFHRSQGDNPHEARAVQTAFTILTECAVCLRIRMQYIWINTCSVLENYIVPIFRIQSPISWCIDVVMIKNVIDFVEKQTNFIFGFKFSKNWKLYQLKESSGWFRWNFLWGKRINAIEKAILKLKSLRVLKSCEAIRTRYLPRIVPTRNADVVSC